MIPDKGAQPIQKGDGGKCPKKTFSQEKARIVREILDKYHFNSGVAITGDRYFIAHRSKRLERLHYEFGRLAIASYVPPEKEKDYMRELKRIRNALKIEYLKLKIYERINFYARIKSIYRF